MKILINTPNIYGIGGVANHYLGLKPYWKEMVLYNSIGSKKWRFFITPYSILKFIYYILVFKPDCVLLNPSLGKTALIRDFVYLNIAKFFGRKVAVFIHGFDLSYAKLANWKWISNNLNKSSCVIVLSKLFKEILNDNGIVVPIYLSTTKVNDKLLEKFNLEKVRTGEVNNLLFLSRIEKEKGVYEVVDAFNLLKHKYGYLKLTFVGDGAELKSLKRYVIDNHINNVEFTGELTGRALVDEYEKADLFIFPSRYGEGMPTVILEAMAFGLPVITRYVGGLSDFFENEKMGYITHSNKPDDFADLIDVFINNKPFTKQVSFYNYQYANNHFLASKVTSQLENIFNCL